MTKIIKLIYLIELITLCSATLAQIGITSAPEKEIPKKCYQERIHTKNSMIGYNCANIGLKEIPTNLRKSFEVLDASYNRIRDLDSESFSRYRDIKLLYLFENMIQNIEPNTFEHLTSLEAIDLSSNALRTIPIELFQLPMLRNIYIYSNKLTDLNNDLEMIVKPIIAPLQIINIADCKLQKVPNFGVLPKLYHLNISSNPMHDILPQQFSPLCNLNNIDLNNTKMFTCSCQTIIKYLNIREITIKNWISCESKAHDHVICPEYLNDTIDTPEYQECNDLRAIEILRQKSATTWILIGGCFAGFIILITLLLYCLHRRNVKQKKRLIKLSKQKQLAENGNKEVLIDNDKL